ncbi:MAG: VWA domain-containing protein [bacterium]|nr:VWA domain-containing protein [bacterium]
MLTFPLAAQGSGMLVLPFQVEGDPTRAGFASRTGISDRLQEASHFLLHTARDGSLIGTDEARAAARRSDWSAGQTLDVNRAGRLCSEARADYLLAGSARFLAGGRILLSATTHICRTGRSVSGVRESTNSRDFQKTLRRLLVRATPFWQPRPSPTVTGASGGLVDLAVVLDHSGSMVEDLPLILRALTAVEQKLPRGSRLGIVTVGGGDRLDVIPFSDQWGSVLAAAQGKAAGGEVTLNGVERALGIVHSYREWKGARKILVFSDARIGSRRSGLEGYLRRLKSAGGDVRLFCLLNQQYEDRSEWRRMARALGLADPAVVYGREAGFVDQPSQFILMDGPRFFLSRRDLRGTILRGQVPADVLRPVETIHYEQGELNLTDLPKAMARKQGTRLAFLGPVVSGLEASVAAAATAGTPGAGDASATRVLVKNAGLSFWIQVADRNILAQMRRRVGQTVYVGLHVTPAPGSGERLVNLSKPVYIRSQGEVPRLFISTWAQLAKRRERDLVRDDVHFLLLQILEIDDGRSSQDIRR